MKNPFVNGSINEVIASEATSFVIQVGDDLFVYQDQIVFSEKSARHYFNKILGEIREMLKSKNKDRKLAIHFLKTFKIHPLRIH